MDLYEHPARPTREAPKFCNGLCIDRYAGRYVDANVGGAICHASSYFHH